ncbi:Lrp/AsnC family transcriptional regulator, partial [Nanoarchaeota archaeon]
MASNKPELKPTEEEHKNDAPVKLDNKDKEIVRLLNENARLTSKAIGSNVNISREVADYRIKRLMKNGLITGYITLVSDRRLGYETYLLLLQLQNYTKEDEKRIIEFLNNHSFTKWVLKCSGDWDIQTVVIAKNKNHIATIIDEIDNFCGENLRKIDLTIIINLLVGENLAFLIPHKQKDIKNLPAIEKVIS